MDNAQPPIIPSPASRRVDVFFKIICICLLIVFLLVPLGLTDGVLKERRNYQQQATEEIAGIWGRSQLVTGPVLAVPYAVRVQVVRSKVVNGRAVQVEESELAGQVAYFLPESLAVTGTVDPEVRHRGIYDAVVYSSKLAFMGWFQPDFAAAGIGAEQVYWDRARVLFGVTDLHGVRSVGAFKSADGKESAFESTDGTSEAFLPLAAKVAGVADKAKFEFALETVLQGSERLEIAPLGKTTAVNLKSAWPDPSFTGASLPVTRHVATDGFKAAWESAHFSRGFPQAWTNRAVSDADMTKKIQGAAFGVRFTQPVDGYSMAERAQKYGVLFFVLVFAVFFLFEVTSPSLKIHPLQYAMVGAALCLFFLAFLALTEFWSTGAAYGAAAAACTVMITGYSWSFLKTGWRSLVIGGGLGTTYGYLYFVLQSQDYALVAGTVALFAALALVMFCTRRINWYSLEMNSPRTEEQRA